MSVTVLACEGYQLVRLTGFLDGHTSESSETQEFLEQAGDRLRDHHVLDLSQVEYVNSSMLGQFLKFLSVTQDRGCQLLIMNPPPSIANVLEMTGLTALMPIVQNEEEIRARLGTGQAKRIKTDDVDFDVLAEEIETIIKGETPDDQQQSQLGRILGE